MWRLRTRREASGDQSFGGNAEADALGAESQSDTLRERLFAG
ncbi:hypothetical protein [Chlorogloeopsis sp. ULAP01]|nr:hypothetical protein [Chlorogloeopsis sp. ULAP01]